MAAVETSQEIFSREPTDFSALVNPDRHERPALFGSFPARIKVHQESPEQDVPLHWHEGTEVIYSRNRTLDLLVDGEPQRVSPGGFALVGPCSLHAIAVGHRDDRQDVLSITYDVDTLFRLYPDGIRCRIGVDAPGADDVARLRMAALLEEVRLLLEGPLVGEVAAFRMDALLFEISYRTFTDFLVDGPGCADPSARGRRGRLVEVLAYIDEHKLDQLSTGEVADRFGYSREHFCRIFKQYSGETFKAYLTRLRLASAASDLLLSRDDSISRIAARNGFTDYKGFVASFRRCYGINPGAYRRAHDGRGAVGGDSIT